jgi:hypothetical protein
MQIHKVHHGNAFVHTRSEIHLLKGDSFVNKTKNSSPENRIIFEAQSSIYERNSSQGNNPKDRFKYRSSLEPNCSVYKVKRMCRNEALKSVLIKWS